MYVSQLENKMEELKDLFHSLPRSVQAKINLRNLDNNYKALLEDMGVENVQEVWDSYFLFSNATVEGNRRLSKVAGFYWIDRSCLHKPSPLLSSTSYADILRIKQDLSKLAYLNRVTANTYGYFIDISKTHVLDISEETLQKSIEGMEVELHDLERQIKTSRVAKV